MVRFHLASALLAACWCCHGLDPYTSDRRDDPPSDTAFTATAFGAPLDAHRRDMFNLAFGPESKSQVTPPARMHATLTAVGSRLYLFGGLAAQKPRGGSQYLNDFHVFDARLGRWAPELARPYCCDDNAVVDSLGPRPSPRSQHAAAFDGGHRVWIFGGMSDRAGWSGNLGSRDPYPQRYGTAQKKSFHGGAAGAWQGYAQGAGVGDDVDGNEDKNLGPLYLNDLHYFDAAPDVAGGDGVAFSEAGRMRWSGPLSVAGSPPAPRASHAMVLLVDLPPPATTLDPPLASAKGQAPAPGAALYVFGGRSGSRLLNDLHRFNLRDMTWTQVKDLTGAAPSPRHFFAACAGADQACLYVFGGLWQAKATPEPPSPNGLDTLVEPLSHTELEGGVETPGGSSDASSRTHNVNTSSSSGSTGAVNGGTDSRAALALNGLYHFDARTQAWSQVAGATMPVPLARQPHSPEPQRVPSPRYGAALIPVGNAAAWAEASGSGASSYSSSSGSSSTTASVAGLLLMGGVDGGYGLDFDDASLFDVSENAWHANPFTGLADLDQTTAARGKSAFTAWTGQDDYTARQQQQHQQQSADATLSHDDGTSIALRHGDGVAAATEAAAAEEAITAAIEAGRAPPLQGGRPTEAGSLSAASHTNSATTSAGSSKSYLLNRKSPSALSNRPEPRVGQAWCVAGDGARLFEFGGRLAQVSPAPSTTSSSSSSTSTSREVDVVSDLYVYSASVEPAWEGRPHGQGANHAALAAAAAATTATTATTTGVDGNEGYGVTSSASSGDRAGPGALDGWPRAGTSRLGELLGAGPWTNGGPWQGDATRQSADRDRPPNLEQPPRGLFVYAGAVRGDNGAIV